MADFDRAHRFTAKWEGGISDDKHDPGGLTAYGVSTEFMKELAKHARYKRELALMGLDGPVTRELMRKIRPGHAARIFRFYFWEPLNCDLYRQSVATVYYDCAVNHGRGGGTRLMQRAVNRVKGSGFLAEDGLFGPKTFTALRQADKLVALAALDCRRDYYRAIVKNKPTQERFLQGWLNRARALEELVHAEYE